MPTNKKRQPPPQRPKNPIDPISEASDLERAVIACLLEPESASLIASVTFDISDDFLSSDHRKFWHAMNELHGEGLDPSDRTLLLTRVKADASILADLLKAGPIVDHFPAYVKRLHELAHGRRVRRLAEELTGADPVDYARILEQIAQLQTDALAATNWRSIFHTYEEFLNAPPLSFAIEGFLQEFGITFIAGLPGHGKTLVMLAIARALLDCQPLFGYQPFKVTRPADRVIYLIPEANLSAFKSRIELFRLQEYIRSDRLLIRTLSSKEEISLSDPRLLKSIQGAHVFLDTAVRFMEGSENEVETAREFAKTLFSLIKAGALTVTGAHHAPKYFSTQDYMILENIVRGSGDLGAAISTAWGLRQVDKEKNKIYIENVKPRDFEPCQPFIIEGRPHLNETGQFVMCDLPGYAGALQVKLAEEREQVRHEQETKILELSAKGKSVREISSETGIPKTTVDRYLKNGAGTNGKKIQ